ncbi:MAG: hypothetical protein Q8L62_09235, partial [Candidatus Nitrotoga sp.]|nr:hypothetical protein [Candidatus Nitrotoga sp.]
PPPTKSGQTVADSAKTIFTERMMKLIVFKTLNAPAKAGGFYQLIEINTLHPKIHTQEKHDTHKTIRNQCTDTTH